MMNDNIATPFAKPLYVMLKPHLQIGRASCRERV